MSQRPYTTLFLLQSLDGKISTGDVDERDIDADFPKLPGIKEGLHHYYEIEGETDPFSLVTGRSMAKIGANTKSFDNIDPIPITSIVIDNKPHLTAHGVQFLAHKFEDLIVVTTDNAHPAHDLSNKRSNVVVLQYDNAIDFIDLFAKLKTEYEAKRVTIQSGGELNAILLRAGLIDEILLVIAPCLIGGRSTSTLVDGESLRTVEDLAKIRSLKLKACKPLDDSYLRVEYEVLNEERSNV